MINGQTHKTKTLQARIVSGSVVLLSGSGLTAAINLTYNLVIARYLGPESFGHATVVYTLLTLLSAVTLSYQIVCSKIVAQQQSEEGKAAAYRMFHRSSWSCGIAVGLALVLLRSSIAGYLNLHDSMLVGLLAIGAAFYIPLGSRRGYIQGTYGFRGLATNVVIEGAMRLGGSFALVILGCGVRGVIAANAAAVAIAYLVIPPRVIPQKASPIGFWRAVLEMSQALFFFAGQALINNCDIVLVTHLFSAEEAGLYSVVAMVGRVIFSFCQAVVNSTFPLVAGTRSEERRDFRVIATSLTLVLAIGSVLALALYLTPASLWSSLFGAGFRIAGRYNLSYLLALYAFKTIIYSLCVVIITYEMSYKIANTSWIQLLFSGVLIEAILRFHSSLRQVILLQIELIVGLLFLIAIPFFVEIIQEGKANLRQCRRPIRLVRQVSEDEVIAEFLKGDVRHPEVAENRDSLGCIVAEPNLGDSAENERRRASLFKKHLSLWTELPKDTTWYEVEVNEPDIDLIRAFPRAHWRKLARGNYSMTEVAGQVREQRARLPEEFLSKIDRIADDISHGRNGLGAVILIGRSDSEPLTVLDGNHRLVAALHAAPRRVQALKFMCGLSGQMEQCCWYRTSLSTLVRYGWHVVLRSVRGPEREIARMIEESKPARRSKDLQNEIIEASSE